MPDTRDVAPLVEKLLSWLISVFFSSLSYMNGSIVGLSSCHLCTHMLLLIRRLTQEVLRFLFKHLTIGSRSQCELVSSSSLTLNLCGLVMGEAWLDRAVGSRWQRKVGLMTSYVLS